MEYKPTLIKNKLPNVKGEKFGPIDEDTYKTLFNNGYIDDEYGIIKKTKKNTKKDKEETLDKE